MKQIAIHHTASFNSGHPQLYAVNRYHKGKWGMKSSLGWYVGYNFFCDIDGVITHTRSLTEETIANVGNNCDVEERCTTISFCFAGDFNQQLPTQAQIEAFRKWVKKYPQLKVTTHRAIQANRTCPGILMTDRYIADVLCRKQDDQGDLDKEEIQDLIKKLDRLRVLLNKLIKLWK